MEELKELINKVSELNKKEEYQQVIELLDTEKLEWYNSSNLYSEKAQSYYRLKNYQQSKEMAFKAISIDLNDIKGNHYVGNYFLDNGKFNESIEVFKKIIQLNPDYLYAYNGVGLVLSKQKKFENAIEYFNEGLKIAPKEVMFFQGLGSVFYSQKKYEESMRYYKEALELEQKNSGINNMIGILYNDLGDIDNAVKYYSKAIEFDRFNSAPFYNRAVLYFENDEYKKSKFDFEKYIELTKGESDFYSKNARSKIIELKKIIKSSEYSIISDLVNKIKILLQFKDGCITHYTSLSVAKSLIIEDSELRLSEGAFLNDTSEGRELFKFLSFQFSKPNGNETIAEKFSEKPFIGSFVAENKHDDLTLWRMYGKEQKEEAKGCALTIDMNKLLQDLNHKVIPNYDNNPSSVKKEEFNFYRVAYRKQSHPERFIIPNASAEDQKQLNEFMLEISSKINIFKNRKGKKSEEDINNILGLLNEIAYLFKSDEYRFENEVRLVVKGMAFEKIIDKNSQTPRVYIELVSIRPLIRKITLGPKVDRADEWAAAFYYNLEKDGYSPEILISHLPFK